MTSPELIAYIRKQLAAGTSKEVIATLLMQNGWSRQDIDQAYAVLGSPKTAAVSSLQVVSPIRPGAGIRVLLSLMFVSASAAYAFFQYMADTTQTPPVASAEPASSQSAPAGSSTPEVANQPVIQTTPPSPARTTTVVNQPSVATAPPPQKSSTPSTAQSAPEPSQPQTVVTPAPTPAPAPKPAGEYVDGSYTGSPADAYYGMVQVQAVIQDGKLAAVNFLSYPSDRSTSRYINSQAMPQLKTEAIQAQSANVDGVSGATDTSQAFIESLGSALAQAKN